MARTRRQQRKKSQSRKRRGGGPFSHLNPRKWTRRGWTPSKWRANPLRMGRDYITARNAGIREGYMLRTDCTADEAKVVAAEVAAAAREEEEMGARDAQLEAEAKGDTVQSVGGRRRRNRRSQRRQSKRGGRRSQRRQRRRRN